MLEYDRIDISEGIDINKTSASKECDICHYRHFLDKAMNFNYFAIVSIKGNGFRIRFRYMSKDDAINITKNSNLNWVNIIFLNYLKVSEKTYYQRNKEVLREKVLREALREKARNK